MAMYRILLLQVCSGREIINLVDIDRCVPRIVLQVGRAPVLPFYLASLSFKENLKCFYSNFNLTWSGDSRANDSDLKLMVSQYCVKRLSWLTGHTTASQCECPARYSSVRYKNCHHHDHYYHGNYY